MRTIVHIGAEARSPTQVSKPEVPLGDPEHSDQNAQARAWLLTALTLAFLMNALWVRAQGSPSLRQMFGLLIGVESLPVVAVISVYFFSGATSRIVAAGLAFLAATLPVYEGIALAIFPGGAPRATGSAGQTTQAAVLACMIVANIVVMVCATHYARGERLRLLLYVVLGIVAGTTILEAIFH